MAATTAKSITAELHALADPAIAAHSAVFFKTGKGEYGEGDRFLGIRVPVLRKLARKHRDAAERATVALLKSRYHEARLLALLMLVDRYERGDEAARAWIFERYLEHRRYVNNWDLVDLSAPKIVGPHLEHGDRSLLDDLARSAVVWDRRIAVMATLAFIRAGDFDDTLKLAALLLDDEHDLIHKATGWMLREIGKRDDAVERAFLEQHYRDMPRTMLRYAIEHLPKARRKAYLSGNVA